MKVIFSCYVYDFHREHCFTIAEEIEKRGGVSIFSPDKYAHYEDGDFTIQLDQTYHRQGGKGIWINHAMPVIPQNDFYFWPKFRQQLKTNSDYIFTFSEIWAQWHKRYGLPIYVVGMPKLDKLFGALHADNKTILYAPTHHFKNNVYSGDKIDFNRLEKFCKKMEFKNVIYRGHPAFNKNRVGLEEAFMESSIVISDYSSVGLEAITLNIPTILIGDEKWRHYKNNHISGLADEAAIRVYNQTELESAIKIYFEKPKHLEKERLQYSKLLCEYQGESAKRFVDVLEEII